VEDWRCLGFHPPGHHERGDMGWGVYSRSTDNSATKNSQHEAAGLEWITPDFFAADL
jgi:hypothetical protein